MFSEAPCSEIHLTNEDALSFQSLLSLLSFCVLIFTFVFLSVLSRLTRFIGEFELQFNQLDAEGLSNLLLISPWQSHQYETHLALTGNSLPLKFTYMIPYL